MAAAKHEDETDSDAESCDSDRELQRAFAKGKLKPGLYGLIPQVKKEVVYNVPGMKHKLQEMKSNLDWLERLEIVNTPAPVAPELAAQFGDMEVKAAKHSHDGVNIHNDFKREMLFYRQAQAAVLEGIPLLHKLGVPTKRPDDYFAQMAKSDEQMQKVREKLLNKEVTLEQSEKARKMRELKKFGKQIQREVLQNRQKAKKEMLEAVKKYRKGQKLNLDFIDGPRRNSSNQKGKPEVRRNKKSKMNRQYKDSRYGRGGQKKRSKYNTSDSAGDVSGYSVRKFSLPPGKKIKKNKRPGKMARQKVRNRKKR